MNEPRTEAGRALLADAPDLIDLNDDVLSRDGLRQVILAIEAEAARTADRPSLREAILNGIAGGWVWVEWPNGMADRVIGAIDAALRQALEGEDR